MYEILFAVVLIALLVSVVREIRRAAATFAGQPLGDEGTHELLIKLTRKVTETNALLRQLVDGKAGNQKEQAEQHADPLSSGSAPSTPPNESAS